jgi:dienelactone hydrolase
MALFEYFPNYIWNLSVAISLESGGKIGEIVDMCAPILKRSGDEADVGTQDFMKEWVKMADKLDGLADEDIEKGRYLSAADKLQRAALYYITAERMQGHGHPGRAETYAKGQSAFTRYVDFAKLGVRRVEVPYEDTYISGYFTQAHDVDGPAPCVVYCNGLDSCKELLFSSGLPLALAKRGISSLSIDQPGTGETLRVQNIPATPFSERWASKCVDWLEQQDDVDSKRIGMSGISLGGHYAARAAAFEPRFASAALWGANHNWAEVQRGRLNREGENPVPHYWSHVQWVFGASDMDDFFEKIEGMNCNGIMDRCKMPFLVTHGAEDRQINVKYAHQCFEQLTNSVRKEIKIFTPREGGVEHVGADNCSFGREYIADWFAETLGGRLS